MTEKTTERAVVMLSPTEKARLTTIAESRGLSLSSLIRSTLRDLK